MGPHPYMYGQHYLNLVGCLKKEKERKEGRKKGGRKRGLEVGKDLWELERGVRK